MDDRKFSLADFITLLRLPLAALIIVFLDSWWKYVFFGLAVLSDGLDGFIAKKMHLQSKWGASLDGIVDKIFAFSVFLALFWSLALPFYYLFFIFAREIFYLIIICIILATDYKKVIKIEELQSRILGKIVTLLQFILLIFLFSGMTESIQMSVYIIFIFSIFAVVDYVNAIMLRKV